MIPAPVDFLVVGASKAGTTTLFEILDRHPDVFVPAIKECHYFAGYPRYSKLDNSEGCEVNLYE